MKATDRDLRADIAQILIDADTVRQRVAQLGAQITADYAGYDDLLLLCVLKGAYMFLSDLSRTVTRPHHLDFMAISSYGAGTATSGAVQIMLDLKQDIRDRHILIVEDIIDSGHTLNYLRRLLYAREPASLRICTLLNKPTRREVEVPVDYLGFDIPDEFVVGYGLDFAEEYRNLPYIAILKPEVFSHLLS